MTNQQLTEAIRELRGIVAVQHRDLDALQARVKDLEQAQAQRNQTNQEHSAHRNNMTDP
jgi:uncharacterized coiled-coil protein SlyX